MKIANLYVCGQCSFESSKWLGRCPQCEAWNSFTEEEIKLKSAANKKIKSHARTPQDYENVAKNISKDIRQNIGIGELDRVLGGGIVPGSISLLTGEPGIGKSTLTLQIAENLSRAGKKILYISGEESEDQISLRGKRLSLQLKNLKLLSETNLETIIATTDNEKPDFLIVDSIQVISSQNIPGGAGSVSQVRLCAEQILEYAKPKKLPVLLIGHVTKDGTLAGPRVLEHLVDGVFILEGERFNDLRLLRGTKNRFGATNEVGVFEMTLNGLAEVKNPSEKFLHDRKEKIPGVALVCTMEGTRPFIVEVQALTSVTRFGYPKRMSSGFDLNRLQLLIAVLERNLKINLGNSDVYLNVVGGLKLAEPAADLGVAMAILSSFKNEPLDPKCVYSGEIGLSGEIRRVPIFERRKKEVEKLGFMLLPEKGSGSISQMIC